MACFEAVIWLVYGLLCGLFVGISYATFGLED